MIRYTLKCANSHEFESWFRSAEAYESLSAGGEITCPSCGVSNVDKAIMAPRVGGAPKVPALPPPQMLAKLRQAVEANSDYVGQDFASEARAIHLGDSPERSIWGEARPEEARALVEDGVPIAPLPFKPTRKLN